MQRAIRANWVFVYGLILLFVGFQGVFAQNVVSWSVYAEKPSYNAGETVRIKFTADIDDGWKMYSLDSPAGKPLSIAMDGLPDGFSRSGTWNQLGVSEGFDPNFNADVRYFSSLAELDGLFATAATLKSDTYDLAGKLTYMTCNDRLCLPPKTKSFSVPVALKARPIAPPEESARVSSAQELGSLFEQPPDAEGTQGTEPPAISWAVDLLNSSVAPGGLVEFRITASWSGDWKMYAPDSPAGRPLTVRFDDAAAATLEGPLAGANAKEMFDPNFNANVNVFSRTAEVKGRVRLDQSVVPSDHPISGKIDYMVCSDTICIPLTHSFNKTVTVSGPVDQVLPTTSQSESVPGTGEIRAADSLNRARSGGLWGFLILAMGAGLAALLTPCVFPMIPLTVSFFAKHGETRGRAVSMSLVYGLAIIATFTGLGVLMAVFVGASGAQSVAANPWINLFIGAVFIFFALSLLGLFELRLPSGMVNFFNSKGTESKGYTGVVFMGLTLTLVSFSCTVPFVGALLAATVDNEWSWPILGMLVFSATFALPFVLFAMFPGWLQSLPKSGSWMNAVKVTLGFVELAAAFKFLSNADLVWGWNLLSRPLVISLVMVIFFLAGLYLIGKLSLPGEAPLKEVGVLRLLVAIGFLGLSFYMLPGLFGAPLNSLDAYLPPAQASDVRFSGWSGFSPDSTGTSRTDSPDGLNWYSSHSMPADDARTEAFLVASNTQKPVFIDFTGYTCTNCRQMEATVFTEASVREKLSTDFTLLQLYTDDNTEGEELQAYQLALTGTVALPTYAIVTPAGALITQWNGIASVSEFMTFLHAGTSTEDIVARATTDS